MSSLISQHAGQEGGKSIPNGDSPEASVARGVRLFCESGGPNNSGEEVLHLPIIVEAAESSPSAATEASVRIRKFLSKDNFQRAYVQYNAIMLVRILADNPGKSFTRNLDSKFANTVKELLREGNDMSVQQILRETLDNFETQKADDETLAPLRDMWKREKGKIGKRGYSVGGGGQPIGSRLAAPTYANTSFPQPVPQQQSGNYFSRPHRPHGLPPPDELAQRVEEAKTSAKLLSQVVQSTQLSEIPNNELIKEFVERCQSASRSVQSYIHSDNPPPDEDTLLTLIETNDQLATAISKHQRALLRSRRETGQASSTLSSQQPTPSPSPNPPAPSNRTGGGLFEAPSSPPPAPHGGIISYTAPTGPPPPKRKEVRSPPPTHAPSSLSPAIHAETQNPFDDHQHATTAQDPAAEMQAAPHNYGLPPPNVSKFQDAAIRNGAYHHHHRSRNGAGGAGDEADDEDDDGDDEEVRRPVQYRF